MDSFKRQDLDKQYSLKAAGLMSRTFEFIASLRHLFRSSDFVYKVTETYGVKLIVLVLNMITHILIARVLGPEGRGEYASALALCTVGVQFCTLGLHSSNAYYSARKADMVGYLLSNSFVTSFVYGSFFAISMYLFFMIFPNLAPINGELLTLSLITLPVTLFYLLSSNILIGLMKVRIFNIVEFLNKTIALTCLFVLLYFGYNDSSYYVGTFMVGMLGSGALVVYYLRQMPGRFGFSIAFFKKNLRYGFGAYISAFFSFVIMKIDILMIKSLLGSEAAGHYSVAVSLADVVYIFPTTVALLLFSKLSAEDDVWVRWSFTKKVCTYISALMALIVGVSMVVGPYVVPGLFGSDYVASIQPFQWLTFAILVMSPSTVFQAFLGASGRSILMAISPMIGSIFNIALNFYYIPKYGILGACYTSIGCYLITTVFSGLISFAYIKKYRSHDSEPPFASGDDGVHGQVI